MEGDSSVTPEEYENREPCEHDPLCSGFGWAHEAGLTVKHRKDLGLPVRGEISMRVAVRVMRAHRKQLREAAEESRNADL